jgi:hypothetical protein
MAPNLLLACFSLGGIHPMIPVFNTFPGADHQMQRWVFGGAQNLAGDIPWRVDRLRSKLLHRLNEFFFFSRFDSSLNEDLNGHDHSSFISECDFNVSMAAQQREMERQ